MHRLLNLVLIALIAVVGWRAFTSWSATGPVLPAAAAGSRQSGALDLPSTARTPPPARLAATIAEQDLFDESRRAPTAKVVEAEPTPPPNVTLIGVLAVGPEREALVIDSAQGNKILHVIEGDEVGGYTVSSISATQVILASPEGEQVPLPLTLNRTATPPGKGRQPARQAKGAAAAGRPTAAGPRDRAGASTTPSVRERLRELRRKRREANKARR
jgi:hypothetical protein